MRKAQTPMAGQGAQVHVRSMLRRVLRGGNRGLGGSGWGGTGPGAAGVLREVLRHMLREVSHGVGGCGIPTC